MIRTKFENFAGKKFTVRLSTDVEADHGICNIGDIVICFADSGEIVASVSPDNFFDVDGNRFQY